MAKKDTNQHLAILQDIRNKVFKPVYLLMGEESYYIDLICETIIETVSYTHLTLPTKLEV